MPPEFSLTHYDVGNSNAAAATFGDNRVVVDSDFQNNSGGKAFREIYKDHLRNKEMYLLGTHHDEDHTSGFNILTRESRETPETYLSPSLSLYADDTQSKIQKRAFENDEETYVPIPDVKEGKFKEISEEMFFKNKVETLDIDVLFPNPHQYDSADSVPLTFDRNDGLIIKMEYEYEYKGSQYTHSTLFPGDMNSYYLHVVADLIGEDKLNSDTLVLPHHGSRNSADINILDIDISTARKALTRQQTASISKSTICQGIENWDHIQELSKDLESRFLKLVDPDNIIISADFEHRNYSHPHDVIFAVILGSLGHANVYCTKVHGHITEEANTQKVDIITENDVNITSIEGVFNKLKQMGKY
ncbi:hypothetical protein [Halorubrum kocurii]|uniref:hypothetical protein n=1 Tax=Halorubrum kocurii TaxID=478441 RepID=UPI0012689DD1|nr:hypothetical protein [Halorubrum kocurii]